jgi:hypothetical protein
VPNRFVEATDGVDYQCPLPAMGTMPAAKETALQLPVKQRGLKPRLDLGVALSAFLAILGHVGSR